MQAQKKRSSIDITWLPERQAYRIRFEATEEIFHDVVRDLKKIDFEHRSYNSATRAWTIDEAELDTIIALAIKYFDNARLVEGNRFRDLHTGCVTEQLTLFG